MQQRTLLALLLLSLTSHAWSIERDEISKLITEKHYPEALTLINTELSVHPGDVDALFLQAVALTKLERYREAIVIYKELIDTHPNLPEPRNNLAVLYAHQGDFQSAEQALQSAINTDPSYAAAQGNLSDIYKTLASIAYNKALSLDNGKQPAAIPEPHLRLLDELHSYKPSPIENKPTPVEDATEPPKSASPPPAATPEKENSVALNDIEKSIISWAKAWSTQDVESYLNSYSTAFIPPDNMPRETWNEQRRERLKSPSFIKVGIEQMEIQPLNNQIASVTFKQPYKSDRFSETTRKLLLLRLDDGVWQIVQEAEIK